MIEYFHIFIVLSIYFFDNFCSFRLDFDTDYTIRLGFYVFCYALLEVRLNIVSYLKENIFIFPSISICFITQLGSKNLIVG